MSGRNYPRVDTPTPEEEAGIGIDRMHSTISMQWSDGGMKEFICGDNWCTGWCGLPALLVGRDGRTWKVSGPQVAMGMLMQELRTEWTGERRPVPEEHVERFMKRWYL